MVFLHGHELLVVTAWNFWVVDATSTHVVNHIVVLIHHFHPLLTSMTSELRALR